MTTVGLDLRGNETYEQRRGQLREAFRAMRKLDLVARMGYADCGTCASYELSEQCEARRNEGNLTIGYAYTSQQDADRMPGAGDVFIGFGSVTGDYTEAQIGQLVTDACAGTGMEVDWGANKSRRVRVVLYGERDALQDADRAYTDLCELVRAQTGMDIKVARRLVLLFFEASHERERLELKLRGMASTSFDYTRTRALIARHDGEANALARALNVLAGYDIWTHTARIRGSLARAAKLEHYEANRAA